MPALHANKKYKVALFVTCLADIFRPQAVFAAVKLLQQFGCEIIIPPQTCCGQPAYNNGQAQIAKDIAMKVLSHFENYDFIVVPSGSCAGMLIKHYPMLFKDDDKFSSKANAVSKKTYELTAFLVDVLNITSLDIEYEKRVAYHDSCSALRELNINEQPRKLLSQLKNITLCELADAQVCCGFGGTFCVKYPAISNKMVSDKVASIQSAKADVVVSTDLGCLLNIAGKLKRLNAPTKVFHIAELLVNDLSSHGIGEGEQKT